MRARKITLVALLTGVLLTGCTGGDNSAGTPSVSAAPSPVGSGQSAVYEQVVDRVLRSVVQITTRQGLGSGIVFDSKGHIVTNAHVVGHSKHFQVTTATSNKPVDATLVASYPPGDLAVIKVSGTLSEPPAMFADSGKLEVGQEVLAMGSPLGLSGSVTNGIVSAVGRTVREPAGEGSPSTTISDMIQTSAAINPGNSGGALVDVNSRVIGIPTLAATSQQDGAAAPGIGFAISSNMVMRIANQIIRTGSVTSSGRAKLGVTVRSVLDSDFQPAGAGVVGVESGGPAAKAGIRSGDVITALNGTAITSPGDLTTALAERKPGDTVKVTVDRDSDNRTFRVRLGEQ
ncbi:MAG: trypsin-like peptidase domain-containing protein [Actinocatenispora sp.]